MHGTNNKILLICFQPYEQCIRKFGTCFILVSGFKILICCIIMIAVIIVVLLLLLYYIFGVFYLQLFAIAMLLMLHVATAAARA